MKRIIIFILFVLPSCSFAQTSNKSFDFEFYKNGKFRNSNHLEIQIIKNLDTITCKILKNKIIIPKIKDSCKVFIKTKSKNYLIDNVNFTKLDADSKIIFGVENNIGNFESIANQNSNFYIIKNTMIGIKIENLEQAKEVNFLVFTSIEIIENNRRTAKSYTQYSLMKKE